MRIHTPKLKAPHPLAVLAVCLLWPAAATVGALISSANAEPAAQVQTSITRPSESVAHHDATLATKRDAKKAADARS